MLKFLKKNVKINKKINFKSNIGNIKIFFIDEKIKIPQNINIIVNNNTVYFKKLKSLENLYLNKINIIDFFNVKNQLYLTINSNSFKNKKSFLNLYIKLIKIKIKGLNQGFKLNLILKGIGFKSNITDNFLVLKLGYSHDIKIKIPQNIKIIIQNNNISLSSNNLILLSQFVHYIKNFKKPEPYKGKGLLLKNEKIIRKEGKINKK